MILLGLNPYETAPDGCLYYRCGSTRIKVTEHFDPNGTPMETLLEDAILYQAKQPKPEQKLLPAC